MSEREHAKGTCLTELLMMQVFQFCRLPRGVALTRSPVHAFTRACTGLTCNDADKNGQHCVLLACQNGLKHELSTEVKRMQIRELPLSIQEEAAATSEPMTRGDAISLLQRVGMTSADDDSAIPRDARLGSALVAHVVDVVLDITLAIQLSEQDEMAYCYATVVLILLAPAVQSCWDAVTMSPFRENKYRILKHILLNLTLLRLSYNMITLWVYLPDRLGHKSLSSMRLFECTLKTLPQLILQCYILAQMDKEEATLIRILSILSGIFSVAGDNY